MIDFYAPGDGTLRAKEQKKFEALIESASSKLLLWPLQTIEYGLLYAVASTSAPATA